MLSSFIDPKLWLTASIGDRVLLDTERGYHVLFPQAGNLLSRPVCYPEHGFYMVPKADGLRAAGTVELGACRSFEPQADRDDPRGPCHWNLECKQKFHYLYIGLR